MDVRPRVSDPPRRSADVRHRFSCRPARTCRSLTLFRSCNLPAEVASQDLSRQRPQAAGPGTMTNCRRHLIDRATVRSPCSADRSTADACSRSLASLVLLPSPCPPAEGWKAGAAKQKITPSEPMWMAGYGVAQPSGDGLAQRPVGQGPGARRRRRDARGDRHARPGRHRPRPGRSDPARIASEVSACRASHVAICCSHTHSGPVVGHNLRTLHYDLVDDAQQQQIDRYAARAAGDDRRRGRPAPSTRLRRASFRAARARPRSPSIAATTRRPTRRSCGPPANWSARRTTTCRCCKITDAAGKLTAVLFGYACHATVLDGYDWSSDYPGFAQSELEAQHPGATALFFAGCGADQNPLPRRKVELARQYGHDLADRGRRGAHRTRWSPSTGNLQVGWTQDSARAGQSARRAKRSNRTRNRRTATSPRGPSWYLATARGRPADCRRPIPIRFKSGDWARS